MTPEEEDRADIALAFMLGAEVKPAGSVNGKTAAWMWSFNIDTDTGVPAFGWKPTEVEAARCFLDAYRLAHRTTKP